LQLFLDFNNACSQVVHLHSLVNTFARFEGLRYKVTVIYGIL